MRKMPDAEMPCSDPAPRRISSQRRESTATTARKRAIMPAIGRGSSGPINALIERVVIANLTQPEVARANVTNPAR